MQRFGMRFCNERSALRTFVAGVVGTQVVAAGEAEVVAEAIAMETKTAEPAKWQEAKQKEEKPVRHADGILIEPCPFIRSSGGRISLPVNLEPKYRCYGRCIPTGVGHRVKLIMLGPTSVPAHRERSFFQRETVLYNRRGQCSEVFRAESGAFRLMTAIYICLYPTQRGDNTHPPSPPSPIRLYFRPGQVHTRVNEQGKYDED